MYSVDLTVYEDISIFFIKDLKNMTEAVVVPHPSGDVPLPPPQVLQYDCMATVIAKGPSPRRTPETLSNQFGGGPGGPGRSGIRSPTSTYNSGDQMFLGTPPRVPVTARAPLHSTPPINLYAPIPSPRALTAAPETHALGVEVARLSEENKRAEGSLTAMASQNVILQNENTKLREEMITTEAIRAGRESELLSELDAMRAQLMSVEHHVAVTEGRFAGLLEATRQEWKTESVLGGRAEAARLTANLIEVQSSRTLLDEKELEIQHLNTQIGKHDTLLLKANAEFTAKLKKAELKNEGTEAQILQLTSALESLQNVVEQKNDFKGEMQDKVIRATRETQERDTIISGLNSQIDKLKQRDLYRERELEADRAALADELHAAGAQSLEDIKFAAVKERERCEHEIIAAKQRETDFQYKIDALNQDNEIAAQEVSKIQLEYDRSIIKISELNANIQQDKDTHRREISELKELMDGQKKELERHWQTYGRVGGAPK